MTNQKTPWDLDVRVRERNMRKGVLEEKDIEKHLKELPDMAANVDNVTVPQPAVGTGSPPAVPSAPSTSTVAPAGSTSTGG